MDRMGSMSASRRTFLQRSLLAGSLIGLLESGAFRPAFAEKRMAVAAHSVRFEAQPHTRWQADRQLW